MPTFRVSGDVRYAFVHEINADSEEAAIAAVEQLQPHKLETVDGDGFVETHDSEQIDND